LNIITNHIYYLINKCFCLDVLVFFDLILWLYNICNIIKFFITKIIGCMRVQNIIGYLYINSNVIYKFVYRIKILNIRIDIAPLKICYNVYFNNEFKCCYQSCLYGIVVLLLPSKYEIKTIKSNEKTFLANV